MNSAVSAAKQHAGLHDVHRNAPHTRRGRRFSPARMPYMMGMTRPGFNRDARLGRSKAGRRGGETRRIREAGERARAEAEARRQAAAEAPRRRSRLRRRSAAATGRIRSATATGRSKASPAIFERARRFGCSATSAAQAHSRGDALLQCGAVVERDLVEALAHLALIRTPQAHTASASAARRP